MNQPPTKPSRRAPLRMDAQDGPWSVSVAENPYDKASYTLYVKTPTHNLTLTRSAAEVIELDHKLREASPSTQLPALPLDPGAHPSPPQKRKSTFLNTLSRLASPASSKAASRQSVTAPNSRPTATSHPSSTSNVSSDPFAPSSSTASTNAAPSFVSTAPSTNSTVTGLAAYLTTVANAPGLRPTRPWKRFFRVRTDDLESVRVERAIKRVRSDLAAHVSPKSAVHPHHGQQSAPLEEIDAESIAWSEGEDDIEPVQEDLSASAPAAASHLDAIEQPEATPVQETDERGRPASPVSTRTTRTKTSHRSGQEAQNGEVVQANGDVTPASDLVEEDDNAVPTTPTASDGNAPRIPRSHSAEPARASKLSRVFTSPSQETDGTPSETGDEASSLSASTAGRGAVRRRKSKSREPRTKPSQRKVVLDDFEMMRVLGKGCAGKVLLVRHKRTTDLYALKAITKRHVLAHQELQHTLTEQAVLKRMARDNSDPFVVRLWWSFHDKENLFLVMDFHPGGDLATQLARWGRLGRDRARFYAAEIVEGVEGLHAAGVIYRDLKPENVLIGGDGHIVLTDFGLSKEFPRRTSAITAPPTPTGTRGEVSHGPPGSPGSPKKTGEPVAWPGPPPGHSDSTSTFCGTAEYLAPEVIQGLPYSYEVDWWSFGTMLYEMLTGITPFWANNHADMYVRVLQDELQFPDDRTMDQDTKSLIRGLLQRNPGLRMSEPRIKKHPYFSMIDWSHVYYKRYIPPYIPPIDPKNAGDTQNFDDTFLDMEPVVNDPNDQDFTDTDRENTDTDRTDGEDAVTTPSQSRSSSAHPADDTVDVFDGYSFKGRHSVIIDDDEQPESSEEETDEDDEDLRSVTPGQLADELAKLETSAAPQTPTLAATAAAEASASEAVVEEEPKTPEARPSALPPLPQTPVSVASTTSPSRSPIKEVPRSPVRDIVKQRLSKEQERKRTESDIALQQLAADAAMAEVSLRTDDKEELDTVPPMVPAKTSVLPRTTVRGPRSRKEKSGIPALDKYLSEDEGGGMTELEDDDWDFVEAAGEEERNGARGSSLFARGVVDKYRLAVFRKVPTTNSASATPQRGSTQDLASSESMDSPSPSSKRRRGRPGMSFKKHPREFLRAKSPPSSFSSKSRTSLQTMQRQNSAGTMSPSSSSTTAVTSTTSRSNTLASPSLRTKESAASVGTTPSTSSSHSGDSPNEDGGHHNDTLRGPMSATSVNGQDRDRPKNNKKVLKKYKEASEKVFSLFSSPRQP